MPRRIQTIKVYPATGGDAPLMVDGSADLLSCAFEYPEIERTLGEPDELTLLLHPGTQWDVLLKSRCKLRCTYDDATFEEWRVREVQISTAGTHPTTIVAWPIWTDLADYKVRRSRPDSTVEINVVFTGMTAQEVLSQVLSATYGCPALFQAGTVAAAYSSEKPVVQGIGITHLDVLRQITERLGCEWTTRWDGSVYRVDLVERVGSSVAGARVIEAPTAYEAPSAANRVDLRVTDEATDYFNRVLPVCGDPEFPTTIAQASWSVDSASYSNGKTTLTLGLTPYPIIQSGFLVGLKIGRPGAKYTITSTTSERTVVVAGDARGLSGQMVRFFDAAGNDLTVLEVPGANGTVEVMLELSEVSPDTNLFEQMGGSADMSEGTTLPDGMSVFGPAAALFETEAIYVVHGKKSLRVQAAKGGGVETIDIPLAPTTEKPYFSFWLNVRVLSGRITAQLVDSAGKLHPPTQTISYGGDTYREISVSGFEPAAGNARIRITALENGTEFVIDSLTLVQAHTAAPYSPMMGPRCLFREGARRLVEAGGTAPVSYEGEFFDVSHLEESGTEVMLGDTVRVRDRYRNGAWEIDFEGRVVAVRETEDKEFGRIRKEVRLERRAPSAVSRFVEAPTVPRGEEVPHKSEIEFAVKEGDTVTSLTLNLEGIHWDGKVFETTNWNGAFDEATYRITNPGTTGAAITKAGDGAFENLWIRGELFVPSNFAGAQHNHDDRYLKLTGGTIAGDLGIAGGGIFRGVENEMHVFAPDGTNHGTLVVQKLVVAGDATIIEGEKVALSDNFVLLNSDWTGTPSQNAGIEINQGDLDNEFLEFDQGLLRWGQRRAGSTFQPFARTNVAESISGAWTVTGTWNFQPPAGASSKVFQFNHGYALYVDSAGAGPANNRLWVEAPDGGEIVLGPRSGNSEPGQFRLRAHTMRLETANYQNGEVSGYGSIFVDGGTLESNGYVSRTAGAQFNFTTGHADVRSLYSDEIQTQAFSADVAQLLVGSEILSKSRATLAESFTVPAVGATAALVVEDLEELGATPVFEDGDTIRLRYISREGGGLIVADAWGTVASYVNSGNGTQSWTWTTRKLGPGVQGKVIHRGAVAYDYGTPGSGMIYSTVLDAAGSPYTQYQTWSDTDGDFAPDAYAVLARLGNLNGIGKTVAGRTVGGNGLYSTNVFLEGVIAVSRGYFGANGHTIVGDNLSGETQTGKVLVGNFNNGSLPIVKLAGHNTTSYVQMDYTSSSDWGLKGVINGNEYFKLSTTSHIGGISFDNTAMWSGTKGSAQFQLNADGSGRLASGNISWNTSGSVTFGSSVTLSWTQVSGRPTNLSQLDATAASKLGGIEAGAQKNPSYLQSTKITQTTIESPTITGATVNALNDITAGMGNNVVRMSGTDGTYRLWVGNATAASAPFRVTQTGHLTATDATIQGNITATTLTAKQGGELAGWQITNADLRKTASNYSAYVTAPGGAATPVFAVHFNGPGSDPIGGSGWRFYVRADGYLYATHGEFRGAVTATSGSITGTMNITGNLNIAGGQITGGSGAVVINNSGVRLNNGNTTTSQVRWSDGAYIYSSLNSTLILQAAAGNSVAIFGNGLQTPRSVLVPRSSSTLMGYVDIQGATSTSAGDIATPLSDTVRIYVYKNSAGSMWLCARFPNGHIHRFASDH